MPRTLATSLDLRKLLAFGSGVGIEIRGKDLEIVAARVRPGKVHVPGRLVIEDYASRPAAEWGAEYAAFLRANGIARISATVLLPRRDIIVRHISLPGVAPKDIEGAIRLQIDTLHPYGEADVVWGWSPLGWGAVLAGIARRDTVERYNTLFVEAGIAVASFTFSAAAVHAAIRLGKSVPPAEGFVALAPSDGGGVEVYGESQARPVFSADFQLPPARAAAVALSELRLPPDTAPLSVEAVLPKPLANPIENDLSRNARPYAAALAGACPWLAPAANVLPPAYRRSNSRAVFIPTAILGVLALLLAGAGLAYSSWSERQYLDSLNREIARLDPARRGAESYERQTGQSRARALLLEDFRKQTRKDLDALNELTRVIEPPAWVHLLDITHDTVRMDGEAPTAAALMQVLDRSTLFERSEMLLASKGATGETFQIRTNRRPGK
ncbi:MAG: PilN domain-containing protein [Acidobacteriota bacterium]|nr:PilN domain-containing protein [Acidobacteriota bacterium]